MRELRLGAVWISMSTYGQVRIRTASDRSGLDMHVFHHTLVVCIGFMRWIDGLVISRDQVYPVDRAWTGWPGVAWATGG